jgi:hypothetical protein
MATINPLSAMEIEQRTTTDIMIDEYGINWKILGYVYLKNNDTKMLQIFHVIDINSVFLILKSQ